MAKGYYFGVEIECGVPHDYTEDIESKLNPTLYRRGVNNISGDIHTDGSIEGLERGYAGREYVTPPLGYNAIKRTINKVCKVLNSYDARGNYSCGLHVHISNNRFAMPKYIKRVVHTWLAIEDVLLATQPPSRLNNRYCYRTLRQYARGTLQDLPHDKNRIIDKIRHTSDTEARYHTLNFTNLGNSPSRQTLEVRMHAYTTDSTKINNWITLLQQVFVYVIDNYNAREVTELFNTKISEDKISRTWELLKIPTSVRQFYATRIQKNLFSTLARQQEAVIKLTELKPAKDKLAKRYARINDEYNRMERECNQHMRVFRS